MTATDSTAVYVSYRTPVLDLSWIPDGVPVVIVHNDDSLDPATVARAGVTHVRSGGNVGFGAGVNAALRSVTTSRVVVVNPDADLTSAHWQHLGVGDAHEVRSVPVVDRDGEPTAVVWPYPTPITLLLTGWRVGRLLGRTSAVRKRLLPMPSPVGEWRLAERWVSGAVLAADVGRLRDIGGFDEGYFLYLEDVDLCRRLAARFPDMRAVIVEAQPAVHAVSASSAGSGRRAADLHYARSARRYASQQSGWQWRLVRAALLPRLWWLRR